MIKLRKVETISHREVGDIEIVLDRHAHSFMQTAKRGTSGRHVVITVDEAHGVAVVDVIEIKIEEVDDTNLSNELLDMEDDENEYIREDVLWRQTCIEFLEAHYPEYVREYVEEAEHQDGFGYWDKFEDLGEVLEDMEQYLKYRQDHKGV